MGENLFTKINIQCDMAIIANANFKLKKRAGKYHPIPIDIFRFFGTGLHKKPCRKAAPGETPTTEEPSMLK